MILLDTCVISEVARPIPAPAVLAWFDAVPEDSLWLSVLSLGEIRKGVDLLDPGPRRDRVEQWLEGLIVTFEARILPVDKRVALRWGSVSAQTQRIRLTRPPIDSLLAATALHHGFTLATRNVSDFRGTGASLVNPWDFAPEQAPP